MPQTAFSLPEADVACQLLPTYTLPKTVKKVDIICTATAARVRGKQIITTTPLKLTIKLILGNFLAPIQSKNFENFRKVQWISQILTSIRIFQIFSVRRKIVALS